MVVLCNSEIIGGLMVGELKRLWEAVYSFVHYCQKQYTISNHGQHGGSL
jgi:hypothetical protein